MRESIRYLTNKIKLVSDFFNSQDVFLVFTIILVASASFGLGRLSKITEIVDVTADGIAKTNTPFSWDPSTDQFYFKTNSQVFEKIMSRYGYSKDYILKEFNLRSKLIYILFSERVYDFDKKIKKIC